MNSKTAATAAERQRFARLMAGLAAEARAASTSTQYHAASHAKNRAAARNNEPPAKKQKHKNKK